jgi:predicted metal-dependent hydrolase
LSWTKLPKSLSVYIRSVINFIYSGKILSKTVGVVTSLSAKQVSNSVSSKTNWIQKNLTWNNTSRDSTEKRKTIAPQKQKFRHKTASLQS